MRLVLSKRNLLMFAIVLFAYPFAAGYVAVSSACRSDGGPTIRERVIADGYLDKVARSTCVGCIEDLGASRFHFVDQYVANTYLNELALKPGFNRYVLRPIDSEACDPWRNSSRWMRDGYSYGIEADKCVALLPVETPSKYVFDRVESTRLTPFGVWLDVIDYEITDTERSTLLARFRMYGHTLAIQYLAERSGPFWTCGEQFQSFRPAKFREQVLLNK